MWILKSKNFLLAGMAIFFLVTSTRATDHSPPNVILIITDDQGYGDFGFTGNPAIRTPHLNNFALHSSRMRNFYVSPVCAPTRASLMTGRYNYRTRVIDTYLGRAMMDPREVTLAEVLGDAGYATGIFGKWHLGDNFPMRPMDQGFEESLVHRGGGIGQPSDPPGGEGRYTDPILFHNGQKVQKEGYCTDIYFQSALKYIEKSQRENRPFFVYLPTNAPHGPFHDVPQDLYQSYKRQFSAPESPAARHAGIDIAEELEKDRLARIFAMITNVDQNVGKLRQGLEQLGLTENTMILFMVDNGPNGNRYVAGLRGQKSQVYEGGIRSPLWVQWPARLPRGYSSDTVSAHIDVMPTILEAAGVDPPENIALDGRSLLPLLQGKKPSWEDRTIFIQSHRGDRPARFHNFAARSNRWKLLHASGFSLHQFEGEPDFELYDLDSDPLETQDVSDQYPEVVDKIRLQYENWFEDVSSTRPNNYLPPRIHVGTDDENPVVLTRQDWRFAGERGGWDRDAVGHWLIQVQNAGPYRIELRFQPSEEEETVQLTVGRKQVEEKVPQGATNVTLENVTLPQGRVHLEAILTSKGQKRGVHQVELLRN